MPKQTIENLERKIASADISDLKKAELTQALSRLKQELSDLPNSQHEEAKTMAECTSKAAHELLKPEQDAELISEAMAEIEKATLKFEKSHPSLFTTLQSVIISLSGLGV